jgi:hypothetical protein
LLLLILAAGKNFGEQLITSPGLLHLEYYGVAYKEHTSQNTLPGMIVSIYNPRFRRLKQEDPKFQAKK